MMWQHCGRLNDHAEHRFTARQRVVVEKCECTDPVCSCPQSLHPDLQGPRRTFSCPGKLAKEGTPAHMPTKVSV